MDLLSKRVFITGHFPRINGCHVITTRQWSGEGYVFGHVWLSVILSTCGGGSLLQDPGPSPTCTGPCSLCTRTQFCLQTCLNIAIWISLYSPLPRYQTYSYLFNLDLTVHKPPPPPPYTFKLVHYEARPAGKRAVGIRLKCLLVIGVITRATYTWAVVLWIKLSPHCCASCRVNNTIMDDLFLPHDVACLLWQHALIILSCQWKVTHYHSMHRFVLPCPSWFVLQHSSRRIDPVVWTNQSICLQNGNQSNQMYAQEHFSCSHIWPISCQ